MKSKNIKIKHRRYNLYNKKKSKGRQALTVILTIVIILALGVIGFGLGRPLMEYFQSQNNGGTSSGDSAWTPSQSDSSSQPDESTPSTTVDESSESTESTPAEEKTTSLFMLPTSALRSTEALGAAVASAKSNGCTGVAVTLKNNRGYFFYKTDIAGIKDTDAVSGTLTAKQITDVISAAGLDAYARIYTLKDPVSGAYIPDIKFTTGDGYTWLDAAPTNNGKSWLCPFNTETTKYIADITTELATAGFKKVVLADTIYPPFLNADDAYLGHLPIRNEKARLDALWSVITASDTAAKASGASILVEVNAEDLDAASKLSTTAEIVGDRTKLKGVELLISYTPNSESTYAAAKTFAGKMKGMYSGQPYSILIHRSGVSDTEYTDAARAFTESEVTVFSE